MPIWLCFNAFFVSDGVVKPIYATPVDGESCSRKFEVEVEEGRKMNKMGETFPLFV